ncbi:Retrovirus-related Pol polyprotein from transposon TNT 1-94 [Vitis vinifera]|uniref:Retrovirus-related Pol polyprotein from transposon TNT 1-94 n=1 Tax=Vitis vinifera TaxID=29760 RepID=A0A438JBT0_VITVI|nr:Retrovirus-related Pol polyprotein from transposon TNT 1-94 [Vitis vinifera]
MDSAPLCVKFTGTNYSTWAFQFELFLKGKDLWGHIDGTDVEKPSTFEKSQDVGFSPSWVVLDARHHVLASWFSGASYCHPTCGPIAPLIYDYYSAFLTLWHEYADLVTADVPIAALSTIQAIHATTRRDQFLMKLRPEYESVRSSLLNRSPVPSLDICFGELLREEQRLSTQAILEQSHGSSGTTTVAYAAQGRRPPMHSKNLQCFCCKEYGHIAATCPKKFCSYCKKKGHIIKECRIRPQNRQAQAFQTSVIVPPVATHDSPSAACSVPAPPAPDYCTPEMVQRILISALSAMGFQGNNSTKLWYVDSGASNHMTNNPTALCYVRPYAGQSSIQTANGSSLPIAAIGDASSKFTDVFLAPQLSTNLISVGQLVDNNCAVNFSGNGCVVQDQVTGKPIAKGPKVGRLFPLFLPIPDFSPRSSIKSFACNNVSDLSMVWHRRLGHPNTQILSHVLNSDLPGNKDRYSLSLECDSCKLGKSKTLPFPLHASRASHCFDLIHSDVWGPSPVSSHEKFKYYVTFIDDHSRFTWVYFLRSKSEVFRTFTEFLAYVDNQFSTSIKTLRTDSGGEYLSTEFQAFLASKGIIHQRSCPSTPQQNGVAERKNRHLLDVSYIWSLPISAYLLSNLVMITFVFFGCVCFVHLPPHERHKLSAQSVRCAFLGYNMCQKGFVCYDPTLHHTRISRNVIFFENQHFFPVSSSTVSSSSTMVLSSFEQQFSDLHPVSSRFQPGIVYTRRSRPQSLSVAHPISDPTTLQMQSVAAPSVRRSSRVSVPPNRYGFPSSSSGNSISALTAALSKFDIPTCYSHAAKHDCWRQAMQEEIAALEANHTWDIEPCPPTIVPLGCKWVYSVKVRSDGSLDRYKARLVALGNNQEYGVNYEETFAPVAKMTTVRTILALAASSDWPLHQMDVKNAFLHGDLKECIYMKPPPGLFPSPTSHVCKLRRSLYGLKQAPRAWFEKFRTTLLQFSFRQSKYDTSLFLWKSDMGIVVLLVYVDDIVITGSDSALLGQLKTHLSESFHMKDLGPLTYFLGLEVHHSPSGISLNQHKYASDLVATAGLQGATSVDTPMELNVKLCKEEGDLLVDPSLYRKLVGSLVYLTITRPDISFAVQQVSQFLQTPRHLHLATVRRIIRYVQGTSTRGLFFPAGNSTRLAAYSDANWAGCADTRRSITGWCVFLGDALISWKSKKQDRVSKSSTESEYRAMSLACFEIIWLRGMLAELDFSETDPTPLHADNISAIQITANPVYHERTKHIEVDCHSIREAFEARVITLPHISTDLQIADIFTKALPRHRHCLVAN